MKEYQDGGTNLNNPPIAIFADVHGDIQIKFSKKTRHGMYVKLNSLEHLSLVLQTSEDGDRLVEYGDEPYNVWGYEGDAGFVAK